MVVASAMSAAVGWATGMMRRGVVMVCTELSALAQGSGVLLMTKVAPLSSCLTTRWGLSLVLPDGMATEGRQGPGKVVR